MSIATAIQNAQAKVAAAYSKCNDKGATMPTAANQNLSHLADTIDSIPTGGSAPITEKDVNFIDYDGTVVYTYTAAEFANLSALPANPSHDGLTAQGWNWTLSDAKTYVAKYGMLEIGQNYVTTDGKTRLYVTLTEWDLSIKMYYTQSSSYLVKVAWGDGSSEITYSGTNATATHTYSAAGNYVITMYAASGSYSLARNSYNLFRFESDQYRNYDCILRGVNLGSNITTINVAPLGADYCAFFSIPTSVTTIGTFRNMYGGAGIVIPSGVTSLPSNAFGYFKGRVSLPKTITSVDSNGFYVAEIPRLSLPEGLTTYGSTVFGSAKIQRLTLGEGITSIPDNFLQNVNLVREIVIPEGVTSIGRYALQGGHVSYVKIASTVTSLGNNLCGGTVTELVALPTTPPEAGYVIDYYTTRSDLKVYVPHGSLSAYQGATGWSALASYMIEMPA